MKENTSWAVKNSSLDLSMQTRILIWILFWITQFIFSCVITVFKNCFRSVLHSGATPGTCKGVFQLRMIWQASTTPLHLLVLPQKQLFWCHPASFLLDWSLHKLNIVVLEPWRYALSFSALWFKTGCSSEQCLPWRRENCMYSMCCSSSLKATSLTTVSSRIKWPHWLNSFT